MEELSALGFGMIVTGSLISRALWTIGRIGESAIGVMFAVSIGLILSALLA